MKRVLIVDDTKNIRTLLTTCLEIEGYEVLTASDGQQALEILNSEIIDLVFLDIKLPQVSGTEVLRRAREKGIHTPVIIMTAFATIKNAIECTKMGAVAYIQKPFTADKIRSVLNEFYNRQSDSLNTGGEINEAISQIKNLVDEQSFQEALDLLKEALSKDLGNPELFLLISKAYDGLGNNELSKKYYSTYKLFIK